MGMRYSGHTDCSPKTLAAAQLQSKEYSFHASSRAAVPARYPRSLIVIALDGLQEHTQNSTPASARKVAWLRPPPELP